MYKRNIGLFSTLLIFLAFACSPKVVEPVQVVEPKIVDRPDEPDNPCTTLEELNAGKREEAETAYVLYKDQIRFKDYDAAFPLWKTAYELAPAANGRIKYQFDDGVKIYKELFMKATTDDEKKNYINKVTEVYNKRIECYGEPYYVKGRLAFDRYYTFSQYVDADETFEMFKEAIDGKGDEADYFVINPFTKMLYDRILSEKVSHAEGKKYANKILNVIEKGLSDCVEKECEAWEIINEYAPVRLAALEGLQSFYDCNYYETKYLSQYLADSTNCDNIDEVLRKLLWAQCGEESNALNRLRAAKSTNCKVVVVSTEPGPLRKAYNAYNSGQFKDAIMNFEEYVQNATDPEKRSRYNILISKIYYRDIKDFPKARKYALAAAADKPNWGEPYLLIGKLYASSGPLCGPGRGWDSQIVTWPAIDMFRKAKNVDPSISTEANKWINTYSQYMPNKSDVFQRNLKEGQSFTVGCWINEKTTIRTP